MNVIISPEKGLNRSPFTGKKLETHLFLRLEGSSPIKLPPPITNSLPAMYTHFTGRAMKKSSWGLWTASRGLWLVSRYSNNTNHLHANHANTARIDELEWENEQENGSYNLGFGVRALSPTVNPEPPNPKLPEP